MPAARYYGYNPPFLGGSQNVMSRQTDERLIKNDLLQLLLTIPGERVYRPTFGTQLRNTVFETLNSADLETLRSDIITTITREEERVTVNEVLLENSENGSVLSIKVIVTLNNNPLTKLVLELAVTQNGVQLIR